MQCTNQCAQKPCTVTIYSFNPHPHPSTIANSHRPRTKNMDDNEIARASQTPETSTPPPFAATQLNRTPSTSTPFYIELCMRDIIEWGPTNRHPPPKLQYRAAMYRRNLDLDCRRNGLISSAQRIISALLMGEPGF